MIATVRIAPVERWCEPQEPHDIVNKYAVSLLRLVGQQIEIETAPMAIHRPIWIVQALAEAVDSPFKTGHCEDK